MLSNKILKLIEERKKRLEEKGYFEVVNKKKIPYFRAETAPLFEHAHKLESTRTVVVSKFNTPLGRSNVIEIVSNETQPFSISVVIAKYTPSQSLTVVDSKLIVSPKILVQK